MSTERSLRDLRALVEDQVYTGCLLLDGQRFQAWLERVAPTFHYRIVAYSPEIRKEMTWLEHDRAGLVALFELLPKHHVDHAQWQRHAVVYQVREDGEDTLRAITSLVVHHTVYDVGDAHLDAGVTRVFAAGRYHDVFRRIEGRWLLAERSVRLETRQLGIGTHLIV